MRTAGSGINDNVWFFLWVVLIRDAGRRVSGDDVFPCDTIERREFPQMLSISQGQSTRPVNLDNILVVLTNLNDSTGSFPSLRVVSYHVLNVDMVSNS